MTKKSQARVARDTQAKELDNYLKTNTAWDDLTQIRHSLLQQVAAFASLAAFKDREEILIRVQNRAAVENDVKLIESDLTHIFNELEELHKQHEGKSGGANDVDSHFNAVNVYQHYSLLIPRIEGTLTPTFARVTAAFAQAERTLLEERANGGLLPHQIPNSPNQDPVASAIDIEFKEG